MSTPPVSRSRLAGFQPRRRSVLMGGAAGVLFSPVEGLLAARRVSAAQPEALDLRYRQVHLDFHTSKQVPGVAADFDADQFASTLKKAHVDSVTVFGRCHHGYLYYDSKRFADRIHPNLVRKHLLNEQIQACHKQGIRAPIYVTIQWDQFTTDAHPEWRQVTEKGELQGTPPFDAGFYRRLCFNSPYADFLKDHIAELFDLVPVDGFFLDIVAPQECSCVRCIAGMQKKGMDPAKAEQRAVFGRDVTDRWKADMTAFIRQKSKTATIFYNGGHIGPYIRPTAKSYSHFELESLPSGGWGYLHFPLTMRYARNLGLACLGMTGKFHTSWGDFHSLKNRAALEFECFNMLALGARCSIGDQLPPGGKLDEATYDLIGSVYASVEQKEPWCKGAQALADIAVVSPEDPINPNVKRAAPSARGVVRMLQEASHQFDVVDAESALGRYKVVVLPDEVNVTKPMAAHLERFVKAGGAIISTGKSTTSNPAFAANVLGVKVKGDAPFSPDFIIARDDRLGKGLPKAELVIYEKAQELIPQAGTETLADVRTPYFNRTYQHFFSHKHAPSTGKVGYPGVVRKGRAITFAHPIFTQYALRAPIWCKKLFLNALELLLAEPLVRAQGPSSLLTALNEQPKDKRWVLHLLHYVPERRGDEFDTIEDVLPVFDLKLSVRTGGQKVTAVKLAPSGQEVPFQINKGRLELTLAKLMGHQIVEIVFA